MKADPQKAQNVGSRLVLYKDSLAKNRVEVANDANLEAILNDTSPDPLAAEQELVMAWRFYTQEREQHIAYGEFRLCSSPEEIEAARWFSRARVLIFDPACLKGVSSIKSQIAATVQQDVLKDAIKWQAVEAQDVDLKTRIRAMYKYVPTAIPIPLETLDPLREKFVEGNFQWCKRESQNAFRKYYGHRIDVAIRAMLEDHRDKWAQRPSEPYDDSALTHIVAFSIYGGNYGLGSLFCAWDLYLESRIVAHDSRREPFGTSTDEERAATRHDRRRRPIEWPYSHPNAREIMESHIRAIIREDVFADIVKWERHKREREDAKRRSQERRLKRIQDCRDSFISKVSNTFGQQVLDMISKADIERYSLGIVDRGEGEDDLWYSILTQYQFDGNTNSCLYFIRQGNAIKIGITNELDNRLAQIKTSAAAPCTLANVVYTHHGRTLERKLHKTLARYNSHLEWFVLPPRIENELFAAKSVEDIEHVLKCIKAHE